MLILMCGLSFSGKSTLAGQLGREFSAMVFSLDSINEERGLDGGQGIPVEGWVETNRLAEERCNAQLQAGRNVIIDDTGSPVSSETNGTMSRTRSCSITWPASNRQRMRAPLVFSYTLAGLAAERDWLTAVESGDA
jgi:shikimate kinase